MLVRRVEQEGAEATAFLPRHLWLIPVELQKNAD
jgi:hypothetical protein